MRLLVWMGRRSRRESTLLWAVWLGVLAYGLGNHFVLKNWQDLSRERVRLQASRLSLDQLEQLLERRDEIMTRAEGLIDDYLQSQRLEASTLMLQRIDRSRDDRTELASIYPLGDERDGRATRFRANLAGPPGGLARLFFALGEGAPPIVLRELVLTADRSGSENLAATALFDVEQKALPEDCLGLLSRSDVGEDESRGDDWDAALLPPFPYHSIDRRNIFDTGRRRRSGRRITASAPTLEHLMRDLALLGVVWGDEPTAVISNRDSHETLYRKTGEFVGEIEIVEITRTAVILRYKDEEGRLE